MTGFMEAFDLFVQSSWWRSAKMMATIGKSANIPIVGTPVMVAAAGVEGEEECKDGVMKLSDMISKLDPNAKEFVPTSLMPATEHLPVNGGNNSSGSGRRSSGRLSANPSYLFMSSWRDGRRYGNRLHSIRTRSCLSSTWRVDQFFRTNEERISRTVHVVDIDQSVTEEQLVAVFSRCGQVLDIRICGDPHAVLRSAFVEFETDDGARAALELRGTIIGFFPISVFPSKTAILPINPDFLPQSEDERERTSRTIYCANIDRKVTHRQVRGFFESFCGQVVRSRLLGHHSHSTRIAFIEFTEAENAHKALNCSGMFLGAFPIRINASKTPLR